MYNTVNSAERGCGKKHWNNNQLKCTILLIQLRGDVVRNTGIITSQSVQYC